MKYFIILLITTNVQFQLKAQGCSDAGFCTLQKSLNTDFKQKNVVDTKNQLIVEIIYGLGENNVLNITPSITYKRQIKDNISWSNKINGSYFKGNLGSISNIGDWFSTIQIEKKIKNVHLQYLLGLKIPFTASNNKINNKALPMSYQSSLGTFDAIAGISATIKNWEMNTALQLPLTAQNKNEYIKQNVNDVFLSTNKFERKADALFRVGYTIVTKNNKWIFKPNLLNIFHLANDNYYNVTNQKITIASSKGVTVNANLIIQKIIQSKNIVSFSLASPLVVRKNRPDGLTRSVAAAVNYTTFF